MMGASLSGFEIGTMPPQLDQALLRQLIDVEVATVGHWRAWGFCDHRIQRLVPGRTIAGTAVTVACPSADNSALHKAIDLIRPGDVLVIDRLGDEGIACIGEGVAHAAKCAGAAAVVVDGPCTDSAALRKLGLDVWSRGISGRTTYTRGIGGRINVPVSVGGVVVMPGDAVLCDDDGVLVLPPHEALSVATLAIEKQRNGARMLDMVSSGGSLAEHSGAAAMFRNGDQ